MPNISKIREDTRMKGMKVGSIGKEAGALNEGILEISVQCGGHREKGCRFNATTRKSGG